MHPQHQFATFKRAYKHFPQFGSAVGHSVRADGTGEFFVLLFTLICLQSPRTSAVAHWRSGLIYYSQNSSVVEQ